MSYVKFAFDRMIAFFGLLILWPFLFLLAVSIKVKMPDGPVFFTQRRVGLKAKLFTLVKFRTMAVGQDDSPVSIAGEKRILPFGALLRKYHIDELPELWNILIGEMSLVGPRPDVPGYADRLLDNDREILLLRPGLTGPATLKYRNEEELLATVDNPRQYNDEVIFPDKVRINRYYYHHYSFRDDIRIIFATITGRHIEYAGELI
ncbi:MAG: sugar transferase [Bacteroidales bacterium]|nr:sugar transferase [Bacteroidales bacterium]